MSDQNTGAGALRRPVDWHEEIKTKWPIACLAAAMHGWPKDADPDFEITREEYMAGIAAAERKVEECRTQAAGLADSTAQNRVFVLAHPGEMIGVVAYRPNIPETNAFLDSFYGDIPPQMRRDISIAMLWDRVLWPAAGSPERVAIMNETPAAYGNVFPAAFAKSLGIDFANVRKKR